MKRRSTGAGRSGGTGAGRRSGSDRTGSGEGHASGRHSGGGRPGSGGTGAGRRSGSERTGSGGTGAGRRSGSDRTGSDEGHAAGHPGSGEGHASGRHSGGGHPGSGGTGAGRRSGSDRTGSDEGHAAGRRSGGGRTPKVVFLYEDNDIVVVEKPAGLPTIAPDGSRTRSLYDIVTIHIRNRNPRGRAAVVHRLDRDTSGVIAFAKNAAAKTSLMAHWNDAVDRRVYIALVEGPLKEDGVLDSWLSSDDPYRVRQVPAGTRGALRAVTGYKVVGQGGGFSLLELTLQTGRRHQIRAQLAAAGHPVAGDGRYGARTDPLGRLCLHATLLAIRLAPAKAPITVESPVPTGFLRALSAGRNVPPHPVEALSHPVEVRPHPGAGFEAHDSGAHENAAGRRPRASGTGTTLPVGKKSPRKSSSR